MYGISEEIKEKIDVFLKGLSINEKYYIAQHLYNDDVNLILDFYDEDDMWDYLTSRETQSEILDRFSDSDIKEEASLRELLEEDVEYSIKDHIVCAAEELTGRFLTKEVIKQEINNYIDYSF
jgi:hypothetical protein